LIQGWKSFPGRCLGDDGVRTAAPPEALWSKPPSGVFCFAVATLSELGYLQKKPGISILIPRTPASNFKLELPDLKHTRDARSGEYPACLGR